MQERPVCVLSVSEAADPQRERGERVKRKEPHESTKGARPGGGGNDALMNDTEGKGRRCLSGIVRSGENVTCEAARESAGWNLRGAKKKGTGTGSERTKSRKAKKQWYT